MSLDVIILAICAVLALPIWMTWCLRAELKQFDLNSEHCPTCGYYCLGKGGQFCIDKLDPVSENQIDPAGEEHY